MDLNFDSTQIVSNEIPSDFGAVPEGKYLVHIAETEEKMSGAGNKYLNLKLQILDGEYKNRFLWDIVNLWHPKDNVREIAQQTMASICRATNTLKPATSEELHHKPLRASISMETDSQYGDQNRVKKYLPNDSTETSRKTLSSILELPKRGVDAPVSTQATTDDIPF
jgi:hypothetical protein|tara:strand:+ start:264 stop:764 length:501 start_codon:yes stop_codon:yes gene_type:complete